ncbi:MAG: helix-turn-helix domain-containing protein, partial [Moorellaceae bacterium]
MNRIKKLRELRGITGPELAEKLGISTQYLYDLENGHRRLHEGLIKKLCEIFGVSADYLLGIDVPATNDEANGQVFFSGSRFTRLSP